MGVCAIAAGCAAVLKVLEAALFAASPPPPPPLDHESEGNDSRKKAAEAEEAKEAGFFDVGQAEAGGKARLRMGRGDSGDSGACRFFLGGSLLRLYAYDDRAALLMPMVTFLGIQSGFLVLNFLKVRKGEGKKSGRKI